MRRNKLITTLFLAGAITVSSMTTVFASTNEVVTLGANLNADQKQEMFNEFGVNPSDVKVITMDVQEIRAQLGMPPAPDNVKGNAFSSAFVRIEEPGYGIKVKTKNLTAVTPDMLSNALLTSGVTDADVIATSPFPVTGTSALAGVLQAFEDATGKEIPVKNKEVARQELSITNNLSDAKNDNGQEIGQNGASAIVNEAKKEVIKEKPKNDQEVGQIVNNVVNNYNVELTPDQEQELVGLMAKINSLDLNYSNLKDQLDNMSNKIEQTLQQSGQELKENGVLDKVLNKILDVCRSIKNWFVSHFGDGKITINGVTYDKNGNMVDQPTTDNSENQQIDEQQSTDNQGKQTQEDNQSGNVDNNSNKNSNTNSSDNNSAQNNNSSNSKSGDKVNSTNDESNKASTSSTEGSSKESSKSNDKSGTITLPDGKVVPRYNDKGEHYNPVTGGYGHIQETEDAGKADDSVSNKDNDYIIVDGKKVPLHNAQGVEYNPETGRYGDVK